MKSTNVYKFMGKKINLIFAKIYKSLLHQKVNHLRTYIGSRVKPPRYDHLMHVKCIHELCIVLLIFQSYLNHIRVISLFYIDFGNISQFPYFSGINPALAEKPIFYILMFQ